MSLIRDPALARRRERFSLDGLEPEGAFLRFIRYIQEEGLLFMDTVAGKEYWLHSDDRVTFLKHRLKRYRRARTYIFFGTMLGAAVILGVAGSMGAPFTLHFVGSLVLVSFFVMLVLTVTTGQLKDSLQETVERSKGARPGRLLAILGLILLFGSIAASWALPGIGFEFGDGGRVGGLQVLLGMALALLGVIIAVRGLHRFLGESEAAGF